MDLNGIDDIFDILRKEVDKRVSNVPDTEIWEFMGRHQPDLLQAFCKRLVSGKFW